MSWEEIATKVYERLEQLIPKGFEFGKDIVEKQIGFLIWAAKFQIYLGACLIISFFAASIPINIYLHKSKEDLIDHGILFAILILAFVALIGGVLLIPYGIWQLKQMEFNPVYYVLKSIAQ